MSIAVGYRFSPAELTLLCDLLRIDIPSGPAPEEDPEKLSAARKSLIKSGLLTDLGGRILIDRTVSFLLNELAACKGPGVNRTGAVLYRTPHLLIRLEMNGQRTTITPYPPETESETIE